MSKVIAKKQALSAETWGELQAVSDILALAAFAADAKRTLRGIDEVRRAHKPTDTIIGEYVQASNNWGTHEDTLPAVLAYAQSRVEALLHNSTEE